MSTSTTESRQFDGKGFVKTLTELPGVYRMLDARGHVLYVGKAKNLKRRVSSYFQKNITSLKTQALVEKIAQIEVTVTHSETEALLLEQTLIKELKPPFNILLRDDKSYPYIEITGDAYPRLALYRGARKKGRHYYGPYPNAGAVRETLSLMQKIFLIRSCENGYFNNRSRPCLQYQIKRCTAPCVGAVSEQEYAEQIRYARLFLEGKNETITQDMIARMEQAASELDFETAAQLRDQIAAIRRVQEQQYAEQDGGDLDLVAVEADETHACILVLFVRGGRVLGSKSFYPGSLGETDPAVILDEFLPQYYLSEGKDIPSEIITSHPCENATLLAEQLSLQEQKRIVISDRVRTRKARWLEMAQTNARENLASYRSSKKQLLEQGLALQTALKLDELPERIECFDISHTQGEATVASCVVFDRSGPRKSDYRRFNIRDVEPGDDYAAIRQAVHRRYSRLQQEEAVLPSLVLIDGGKGQLAQAKAVFEELQLDIPLLGVSKGVDRRAGQEKLLLENFDGKPVRLFSLKPDSPALHLIQQIRDEAHRFAITGHRGQRARARKISTLQDIPGVGAKRRQALLKHFGGLQGLKRASAEEIARVRGVSQQLAQQIYDALRSS